MQSYHIMLLIAMLIIIAIVLDMPVINASAIVTPRIIIAIASPPPTISAIAIPTLTPTHNYIYAYSTFTYV